MEENERIKKCSKCGKELPVSEFNKNSNEKDGLQRWCRTCHAESMKKYLIKRGLREQQDKEDKLHKVYSNPDLAKYQPRELIEELKARGYSGELKYTQRIII